MVLNAHLNMMGIIRKQEQAFLIKMHETSGITGYVIIVEDRKVLNKLELSFILINITPPRPPPKFSSKSLASEVFIYI